MNMTELLEESARYRLSILNLFDLRKGQFTSLDLMVELLGISKFKLNNYLVELEQDLVLFPEVAVHRLAKGEVDIEGLTNERIRKIRLKYLKESQIFQLLHEMVTNETTPEKFAQRYFLSRSKAYLIKSELSDFLAAANIKIAEGRLVGSEEAIRRTIFDIYYFYFNGLEYPFEQSVKKNGHEIAEVIRHVLDLEAILTRRIKLDLFIGINLIRIRHGYVIESDAMHFEYDSLEVLHPKLILIERKLHSVLRAEKEAVRQETTWLIFFLLSEEGLQLADFPELIEEPLKELTAQQTALFFAETAVAIPDVEILASLKEMLKSSLNLVNFKLQHANYSRTTFISANQKQYFAENYRNFHLIAERFAVLAQKSLTLKKTQLEDSGVYYDYLFALISTIPQNYLVDQIYVCVDFSRGSAYSEYIAQNILAFRSLNVVVQRKINHQTQIYVSDFLIDKLTCEQIIWKNPPTDDDWLQFGDLVIKVRNT